MEYQALYRRYRPRNFDQIIGQHHITDVLKNQIASNQVSHAYLFSGTRGTGKTSTAKIFARAVNCESPIDGEPCMKCPSCIESMGESVDIIELDAASNNRVDDIRAIIEKAVFTPIRLKKKVYIIDEAHMLTPQAFNALLKTLEEPPSHVLFILATTEPQKILPTIVSRCQRFDFRRLSSQDIVGCLEDVLKKAEVTIEHDGLLAIAAKASGGMRDALSLADQCISLCGNDVTAEDVRRVLGDVDSGFLFGFADAVINSDAEKALGMIDEVCAGRDISLFLQDATAHFRALLLTSLGGSCMNILDCTPDEVKMYEDQAKSTNSHRLMRTIDILSNVQSKTRYLKNPRPLIEVEVLRAMYPTIEESADALLDRIAVLEARPYGTVPAVTEQNNVADKKPTEKSADDKKEKTKPKPQKKDKGQDTKNAGAIYDEIVETFLKSKSSGEAAFIKVSLKKASGANISGKVLNVNFTDKTHYNTAQKYRAELENVLLSSGHDLKLAFELTQNGADEDIENVLKSQFGSDIEIVD